MQSIPVKRTTLITLLLMNTMVFAMVRPVNVFGLIVMNVAAFTVILVAARVLPKQTPPRLS